MLLNANRSVAVVFFFVLFITILHGEERIRIGVLDLTANTMSKDDALTVTGLLRGEMVQHGAFDVLDRANMGAILKEVELQQSGITEQEYAVRLGRMLNMQAMAYGALSRLGDTYVITVDIVDIQSGKIIRSAKDKFGRIENADEAVIRIVNLLATGKKSENKASGGLIAHWPLAGDLKDISPNGFDAEMPGGKFNPNPASGRTGSVNSSFEFNGYTNANGGQYIEVSGFRARQAVKPTRAITVMAWAYMDNWEQCNTAGSGITGERSIMSTAEGGGWAIYCNSNNRLGFSVYVDGKYREPLINAAKLVSGWHHLAGTYDSGTGTAIFYLDGQPVSSVDGPPSVIDYTRYPNTSLVIGADAEDGGGPESLNGGNTHFSGRIADVYIYDRALSDKEITSLYKSK